MCLSGAKSETARQLKDVLQLTNLTDDDILKMNDELIKTVNNDLGRDIIINTANKIYSDEMKKTKSIKRIDLRIKLIKKLTITY